MFDIKALSWLYEIRHSGRVAAIRKGCRSSLVNAGRYKRSGQTWSAACAALGGYTRGKRRRIRGTSRNNRSATTVRHLGRGASPRAPFVARFWKKKTTPPVVKPTAPKTAIYAFVSFFSGRKETAMQRRRGERRRSGRVERRGAAGFKMCRLYLLVPVTPY